MPKDCGCNAGLTIPSSFPSPADNGAVMAAPPGTQHEGMVLAKVLFSDGRPVGRATRVRYPYMRTDELWYVHQSDIDASPSWFEKVE